MKLKIFFFLLVSIAVVVPSTKSYKKILKKTNFNDIDLSRSNYSITRTEIEEFYNEDFEEQNHGWELNSWFRSSDNSSSGIYSIKDPWEQNSNAGQVYSVISPEIEIVDTFGVEMIQYGFDLWCDIPDYDGDGDSYLEDYYVVSANIPDSTGWQLTTDGSSSYYWCGNQEIGGYMDGWVQFLDTPSISLPNTEIQMSANMEWYIENQEAAEVEGTCVDGWAQANVEISTDNGASFSVINGSDPYDFSCGYGSVYNGFEGMPGWGGISDWHTVTFDLTDYAGQEVILRFGFYSDPEWSAIDDPSLTGFKVTI